MTAPTNAQEYGWNPTGAAWAIQNLWWHYEFTQNEDYLKNTIYPIMKEAAQFWDSYLWTSEYQKINDESSPYNGQDRLVVAPSFSEEQGPTAIGTTYDQSLVWELYKECIQAGKIVGEDEALLKSWEENMTEVGSDLRLTRQTVSKNGMRRLVLGKRMVIIVHMQKREICRKLKCQTVDGILGIRENKGILLILLDCSRGH